MVSRRLIAGIGLILVLVFLLACAPKAAPAPAPQAPVPKAAPQVSAAPAASAKPAWEIEWEKTLEAARKEGKVVVSGSSGPSTRVVMQHGMKEYGISFEALSGRTSQIVTKVAAERRAGLYSLDFNLAGYNTILDSVKPVGMLDPLDSLLILPDVTDPELIKKTWYLGQLPWVDKDHTIIVGSLQPRPAIGINTKLVKPDEMKSYRDLLNPKWKGKIVSLDPTRRGGSANQGYCMLPMLPGLGDDFLKELAKMDIAFTSEERLATDWLVQGKYPIYIFPDSELMMDAKKAGAPAEMIYNVKEGTYVSAASSGLSFWNKAPHPNAAKVFINWFLSKQGQAAYTESGGYHSPRLDVPPTSLPPEMTRQPGVKYYDAWTEEANMQRAIPEKKVIEIFGPLVKR